MSVLQIKRRAAIVRLFSCLLCVVFLLAGCDRVAGLKKITKMEIGKPAPDFILQDVEGRTWMLSSLKGKAVFVNFWATWCKPCRDEMPSMEALNRDMNGRPFQMLTIVFNDDPEKAYSYARQQGATFPVLANPGPELTEAFMINGVPETFLIDAGGILRHKFIGPCNWTTPEMRDLVQGLFPASEG